MTFTIVSHLKDQLSRLVVDRRELRVKMEAEKERQLLEVGPGRKLTS